MSPSFPLPSQMSMSSHASVCAYPAWRAFPQDSSAVKSRKNFAVLTMQVLVSITTIPPEPTIAPLFLLPHRSPDVRDMPQECSRRRPPNCTALNFFRLFIIPPPMSKMIFLRDVSIGTSTRPTLFIAPVMAKTLVPELFSVPSVLYQPAPFKMI